MTKHVFATLAALCGLTTAAPAQVYTSWYSPAYTTYYHAPAYSTYSYSSNYGPLGLVNWGAWRPTWSSAYYTSPYYGSTAYTTAYAPTTYTAAYAPLVSSASFYAPVASSCCPTSCCPTTCCDPCLACASCPSGGCPGGNCGLNYGPVDMTPRPDSNASGSSGSRTIESESNGTAPNGTDDGFRRSQPADGDYGATERGTGYRPQERIERRAPVNEPDGDASEAEVEEGLNAPAEDAPEADAGALLNLDTQITQAPSLLRERLPMRARFGSPKLARVKIDPGKLPGAADLRIVRK